MEKLKSHMRFHYLDTKKPFLVFWGIVIIVNILGHIANIITMNTFFGVGENGAYTVVGGNYIAIGIFIIVTGMVMYTETFPAVMDFGSTRKDFYIGSVVFYVLLSLAMTLTQVILLKLELIIAPLVGVEVYQGFELSGVIIFFTFLILSAVFNLLGVINHKIGYWTWLVIAVVFAVFTSIGFLRANVIKLFDLIFSRNIAIYSLNITIVSTVLFYLGWLFIKKHDIKSKN